MAEASWPFYGVETNETQFSKWARALAFSGIASGLALTPGTAMQVILGIGQGLVRGVFYENDSNKTLVIGAAPAAGLVRLDAIVLRLDQAANTITAVVKAGGTNSTTGTLPALTQNETTWELLIGTVTVANGTAAITGGMINALRPSTGLRVYPYDTAKRPTPSEDVAIGVDLTTKRLELWAGAAWVNLSDFSLFAGILAVAQGGTGVGSYKALRDALDIRVQPTDPGHKAGRVWIPGTALV